MREMSELQQMNDTLWPVPFESAVSLFEKQAAAHPDRIAARGTRLMLSYGDLNEYANRLANALL